MSAAALTWQDVQTLLVVHLLRAVPVLRAKPGFMLLTSVSWGSAPDSTRLTRVSATGTGSAAVPHLPPSQHPMTLCTTSRPHTSATTQPTTSSCAGAGQGQYLPGDPGEAHRPGRAQAPPARFGRSGKRLAWARHRRAGPPPQERVQPALAADRPQPDAVLPAPGRPGQPPSRAL